MVTLSECIGMCDLSEEEVDIVARHEHLPPMVAAELGQSLLQTRRGTFRLHQMFIDCLAAVADRRDFLKEKTLAAVYAGFRTRHPMPRVL